MTRFPDNVTETIEGGEKIAAVTREAAVTIPRPQTVIDWRDRSSTTSGFVWRPQGTSRVLQYIEQLDLVYIGHLLTNNETVQGVVSLKHIGGKLAPKPAYFCTGKGAPKM